MLAWDTKYPPKNDGAAAAVEAPKNDGAAAAVEASASPPRTPDRPTTAANEPRQKRGMTLSDDEGQADK